MTGGPPTALDELRRRFRQRAAEDLAQILAYRDGRLPDGELRFVVHRLNGAAGTFGYPAVSAAAAQVEAGWLAGQEVDPVRLETLVAELQALANPA